MIGTSAGLSKLNLLPVLSLSATSAAIPLLCLSLPVKPVLLSCPPLRTSTFTPAAAPALASIDLSSESMGNFLVLATLD